MTFKFIKYRHGPLSRVVIGQQQVQGIDYVYTLQGWLKGVNSTALTPDLDMGGDGKSNGIVARDAFGFALHYFGSNSDQSIPANDYKPVSNTVNPFANGYATSDFKPLFNGNIAAVSMNLKMGTNAISGSPILYDYTYDQLNRLVAMRAFSGLDTLSNMWSPVATQEYAEDVMYDANGNILSYNRNGAAAASGTAMDALKYTYYYINTSGAKLPYDPLSALPGDVKTLTNQLAYVTDDINSNYTEDIDNQLAGNYDYDGIGNLIKDVQEGITSITWNVYGKIKTITKTGTNISYTYDASGNRISKNVNGKETWYVRDASGNVLSVYTKDAAINNGNLTQSEVDIYGSSRLGILNKNNYVGLGSVVPGLGSHYYTSYTRGMKYYELTNHLGNILSVVSDRKKPFAKTTNQNVVDFYAADIKSVSDYYPFGMEMPERKYTASSDSYRYGFQKQEIEKEIWGGAFYFKYRLEDPRIGRFASADPMFKKYPYNSPYAFAENKVGMGIELEGAELLPLNSGMFNMNYSGDNKAPCLTCRVPSNGSYSVTLNKANVPRAFKDNAGTPLFTPASVNVGPDGPLIPDRPYASISQALPGNRLPVSPEWSMGSQSVPSSLYKYSKGTSYYSVSSGIGSIPYSGSNTLSTFGGVAGGVQEGFKYVQLFGHDVPIWKAYDKLYFDKSKFFTAQTYANAYINANKNDAFLSQPQVRADMTNFIYNGSIRPMLEPGSNYFDRLNYNLQLMNSGINFLKNNNLIRPETLNQYNSLFQLYKK